MVSQTSQRGESENLTELGSADKKTYAIMVQAPYCQSCGWFAIQLAASLRSGHFGVEASRCEGETLR